jgi:RNase P/RNase MRP subunit p29
MRASGEVARGPVDLGDPRIVASTSNEATVRSCLHDAEVVVSRATGQPVPGIEGRVADELVVSLMVETEGEWKLSDQTVREDECGTL